MRDVGRQSVRLHARGEYYDYWTFNELDHLGYDIGGDWLWEIGNNLSGIFASSVSGETGMTVASAHAGYTFGFWLLMGAGVLLFLIAPLIQRLMHGVK